MDFVKLRDDQRRFFDEEGYLVVRDALRAEEVARLTEACDSMMAKYDERGRVYKQFRDGIVDAPIFRSLIAHSGTVPLVIQLLSPEIHLQNTAIIYKDPEGAAIAEPTRAWHRDIGITQEIGHARQPRVGIKVCYCLTDFPAPDSGMTRFARKSHLLDEPLGIPKGERDPPEVVQPICTAGDVVFFENRIFHTKSPNLSDRTSKVVIYGYSYNWIRNGFYLENLGDDIVADLTDIEKQLLDVKLSDHPNWRARPNTHPLADWAEEHGVMPEQVPWVVEI